MFEMNKLFQFQSVYKIKYCNINCVILNKKGNLGLRNQNENGLVRNITFDNFWRIEARVIEFG